MPDPGEDTRRVLCQICGDWEKPPDEALPATLVRPSISRTIAKDHPSWSPDGYICLEDLNHYRAEHVEDVLEQERGELSALEAQVIRSLEEHEILATNINAEFDRRLTFGERLSDRIAVFGGSWTFILTFFGLLIVWIGINSGLLLGRPYDPYPYILLNLILSCLAAMQAPVIMMSQNRQEQKDRLRGEHDYRVDLKAEVEIRNLNAKMDQLLTHQWSRLLEIQKIQTEMMRELIRQTRPGTKAE